MTDPVDYPASIAGRLEAAGFSERQAIGLADELVGATRATVDLMAQKDLELWEANAKLAKMGAMTSKSIVGFGLVLLVLLVLFGALQVELHFFARDLGRLMALEKSPAERSSPVGKFSPRPG